MKSGIQKKKKKKISDFIAMDATACQKFPVLSF